MTTDPTKIVAVDPLDGGAAGKSGTSAPTTERPGDSPRRARSLPAWDTDDSDDLDDRWYDALTPAQTTRVRAMFDRRTGGGR